MGKLVPHIPPNDPEALRRALNKIASTKLGPGASPTFAGLTLTGLTASTLLGANASKLLESVTVGTGLDYTRPNLTLSHLGIEALTDPGADRIMFWDDSATPSACEWLTVGPSIVITTTNLDTIQDIQTSASPDFAGLTLTNAAVIGSDSVVFQPTTDSTTFLQVLDADGGTPIFNVDTTNERVGIGTISPYSGLHYQGDIFYLTPAAGPESNDNITIKNYATGNGAPDIILRTADIAGAYGIGVGTLSLIGGSKTTHYGGTGHGGGKISLQGGQGRDAANDPSYYAPVLLQPTGGNVGIGTGATAPNAPLEVKGAKPGVVGGHQSGQLQVTGSGGEFYCAVITGHNSYDSGSGPNTQLWYLGNTSSSSHNDIAFINRQNAPLHFYTNNASRVTIGAAGNVTLATIAAEGSDVDKFLVSSTGEIKYRTGVQLLSDIGGQASDAGLTSLAGLVYASDSFIKVTATDTYAIRTIAETKTDLSLNLVENTALSTWVGTANITTLGTIATGTWASTDVGIAYGGTGQSTAQLAINALTVVSGATNEYVLTKDTATGNAIWKTSTAGTTFISLTDVDPANYTGEAGNAVIVNAGEDGLEFGAAPGGGGAFTSYCSVGLNGNQNISASTYTKVALNSETYDNDNEFTGGTFTAIAAGYYHISATVRYLSLSNDELVRAIIYKNGVRIKWEETLVMRTTYISTSVNVNGDVYLNGSTDYIEFYTWTSEADAIDGRVEFTYMDIHRFA